MSCATITPIRICELTHPHGHPDGTGPGDLFVFLVRSPEFSILVDTGVGTGYPPVDQRFGPKRTDLLQVLQSFGMNLTDLKAIVCTHLHFDHCGNNRLFPGLPIYVQRLEYEAAQGEMYTVKEWVNFARAKYVQLEESFQLAPGVALIQTPGHTVGHQSIAVDTATGLELIVAQAAYTAAEFESYRTPTPQSTDNASSIEAYVQSIRVLHDMNPKRAYFNHDSTVWHAET